MSYRTGAAASAYPPAGGRVGTPTTRPLPIRSRTPIEFGTPDDEDDEDPNSIGVGRGGSAGTVGMGAGGVAAGPVKLDPFADVNYQGLVSALTRGEDEARNDATFQANQIDGQLSRALAELQRAYGERRGNLTTNMRTRGAYDSSQRGALTGKLYEGEQRDADGARFDASGRKSAIQMALARLMADFGAQRSRGALDAAGRLQAAEDARLQREQMMQYQRMMQGALASQQDQLMAALQALMGGGAQIGIGGKPLFPDAATPMKPVGAGGGGVTIAGVTPNNAFRARV